MAEFFLGTRSRVQKPPFYTPILPGAGSLSYRLRAAYIQNENTGNIANDSTHNKQHATIIGPGGWSFAPPTKLGAAVRFDGNTYIQSPQGIYMSGPGHTVSCRIVVDGTIALAANNWIWSLFAPGPTFRSFLEVTGSTNLSFGLGGAVVSGGATTAGKTYDIMCITDGAMQFIYVNGALITSRTNVNPIQKGFYSLKIGAGNLKDASNNNFGGWIDAFYLWDRALSANEVGGPHYAPFAMMPPASGMRRLWAGNASRTVSAAIAYTLSGPTVGGIGVTSAQFTVQTTPIYGTISGTCTITPSDNGAGGTFTPSSVTVTTSQPNAVFVYVPFAGPTAVISVTNDKGLTDPASITMAIPAYVPPAGTIPVTDTNFNFSPGTWRNAGGSPPVFVTNNPGAYWDFAVDGAFNLAVQYDPSAQIANSVPLAEYPVCGVSMDNMPYQVFQTSPVGVQSLLSSQVNTRHLGRLQYLRSSQAVGRWGDSTHDPATQLRITNLLMTPGATSALWPFKRNLIIYIFGTSITEGVQTESADSTLFANNSLWSWAAIAARALGAEYGQMGFGGSSIALTNSNGVPGMYFCSSAGYNSGNSHDSIVPTNQAWSRFDSQHSRLVNGKFSPQPDIVIIEHGTNDAGHPLNTNLYDPLNIHGATGLWPALRAAMLPDKYLFHQLPFSSTDRDVLLSTAATYGPVDPKFGILDPGLEFSFGLGGGIVLSYLNPSPSIWSFGNVHPTLYGNAILGALIAAAIRTFIGTSSGLSFVPGGYE